MVQVVQSVWESKEWFRHSVCFHGACSLVQRSVSVTPGRARMRDVLCVTSDGLARLEARLWGMSVGGKQRRLKS